MLPSPNHVSKSKIQNRNIKKYFSVKLSRSLLSLEEEENNEEVVDSTEHVTQAQEQEVKIIFPFSSLNINPIPLFGLHRSLTL